MKEMNKTSYHKLLRMQGWVRDARAQERYTHAHLPGAQKYYAIACTDVWRAECALVGFRLQYEQEDLDSFVPL